MTRYLVTGGTGFIGSNFIHHLFHARAGVPAACCADETRYASQGGDRELAVLNVDKITYAGNPEHLDGVRDAPGYALERIDVCDSPAIDRAVRDFEPDVVVHFAAESHVDRSIEAGGVFVRTNVLGTQTLLEAARRHDVPQFLHVGTDEVYGSIEKGSFREADRLDPSSAYSASKAGADLLALAHHRTYGLAVTVTRCTNNYGPRQHSEKLLPKIVSLAMKSQTFPIYGTGLNVRDWLYVKDHCTAIERVIALRRFGEVFHMAGRDERTNLEVARAVLSRLGKPERLIELVKDRPGHDFRYSLDDAKLRGLAWAPRSTFDQGLADTIAWIRARDGEA